MTPEDPTPKRVSLATDGGTLPTHDLPIYEIKSEEAAEKRYQAALAGDSRKKPETLSVMFVRCGSDSALRYVFLTQRASLLEFIHPNETEKRPAWTARYESTQHNHQISIGKPMGDNTYVLPLLDKFKDWERFVLKFGPESVPIEIVREKGKTTLKLIKD